MPIQRPNGYYHAITPDGALTVSENDPGLGAARVNWIPRGNFPDDKKHSFRIPMEAWEKIFAQKTHEVEIKQAKALAEAEKAKKSGQERRKDVRAEAGVEGGGPGF